MLHQKGHRTMKQGTFRVQNCRTMSKWMKDSLHAGDILNMSHSLLSIATRFFKKKISRAEFTVNMFHHREPFSSFHRYKMILYSRQVVTFTGCQFNGRSNLGAGCGNIKCVFFSGYHCRCWMICVIMGSLSPRGPVSDIGIAEPAWQHSVIL